ncbi:hypothetical protein HPP92_020813 [Vanilla planifolia]|uniref:PWWP domain-containing protein n=1 Tax=Vanilla planifolia TaxID=51239 RepID=A0A835PXZ5_VANPL|nr:hypothetical protein HPP92_020813 [Vanilla planifolia]
MGASEVEDGAGIGVDCSVGTIVWVRRRNGSWWPGRILGPEELSASHLMSPRSGTPVKLLGREDASVDWYNLEKSKRVKAFRCGEFDACIERAEASQGTPTKKREKYARREDAILHALDLEKQQHELKGQNLGVDSNFISNEIIGAHEYPSREEQNLHDSSFMNKARGYKFMKCEEDGPEGIPRMRGLRDFGLRTAQSKSKLSQSLDMRDTGKPLDGCVEVLSSSGMEDASHASSSKNSRARKKRSQSGGTEDSLIKNVTDDGLLFKLCKAGETGTYPYLFDDPDGLSENGGHNPENLLICASEFGAGNGLNDPFSETGDYTCSGSIETNHFASSETDYLEPDIGEIRNVQTDALVPGSKFCEPPEFQVPDQFMRSSENKMLQSGILSHLHEQVADASSEVGVAKWHLKGKRNVRNTGKRNCSAVEKCNGFINEIVHESKENSLNCGKAENYNQRASTWDVHPKKETVYTCEEGDLIDEDFTHNQLNVYDDWANFPLQFSKDDRKSSHSLSGPSLWENDKPSDSAKGTFWDDPSEQFRPVYPGNETETCLIDVDLKVEASYQGEHVPLVSLMSRWNGKAIIGHPLQIEILENGSTSRLLDEHTVVLDDPTARPPAWRTAQELRCRESSSQSISRSIGR